MTLLEEWRAWDAGNRRTAIRGLVVYNTPGDAIRERLGGLTADEEIFMAEWEREQRLMSKCGKRIDAVSKCVLEPKHEGPCSPTWIPLELRRQILAKVQRSTRTNPEWRWLAGLAGPEPHLPLPALDWSIAERALGNKSGWWYQLTWKFA
jgi:hypothetical protein